MRKNTTRYRLGALLVLCCLLTGCASQAALPTEATLPPSAVRTDAPILDADQENEQTVLLYLPALDGTRLIAQPTVLTFSMAQHSAQTLCAALLSYPETETTGTLGGETELSLLPTEPIEISGAVATVNLSASALRLSHRELFTVGQALANTLGQFGDIAYVNLLVNGAQTGLDTAATLPSGCFQPNTQESLDTLWARASAQKNAARPVLTAALYFPATAGRGVLCEGRTLSFPGLESAALIKTLLSALSAGAGSIPNLPHFPDLVSLLTDEPAVVTENGQCRAQLCFAEEMNQQLIDAGIPRSVMVASLGMTLTTFLPAIDGLTMQIGSETLTSLTPSGTLVGAGETVTFEKGLISRRPLSAYLLDACLLYFADNAGKLQAVSRTVPHYEAHSVRAIVREWMVGPQTGDSVYGLKGVFPSGLQDADLLGVAFRDGTLRLNFSERFSALAEGLNPTEERLAVYSLVDTLCTLRGVKRVSLFVMGKQPETLSGAVSLAGDFLPNLDLIR